MSKSNYPRGVPFKSPEGDVDPEGALHVRIQEMHRREAQLQRWMIRVALGTVVLVVLIVGTGVFFIQRSLRRPDATLTGPVVPTDPKAKETKPSVIVQPEQQPLLVPREPPAQPPAGPRERSLEALGGLSAAHLYQSYLNIGMLADAAENDVYPLDDAKKLLVTILAWMENVDQQLQRLAAITLEAEDQKRVGQVREVTTLLRVQAKELRAYWDTPETDMEGRKDHETKFHRARESAWSGIKELLGIKDE